MEKSNDLKGIKIVENEYLHIRNILENEKMMLEYLQSTRKINKHMVISEARSIESRKDGYVRGVYSCILKYPESIEFNIMDNLQVSELLEMDFDADKILEYCMNKYDVPTGYVVSTCGGGNEVISHYQIILRNTYDIKIMYKTKE